MKIAAQKINYNLTNKEFVERYVGRKVLVTNYDETKYFEGTICGYYNSNKNDLFDFRCILVGFANKGWSYRGDLADKILIEFPFYYYNDNFTFI